VPEENLVAFRPLLESPVELIELLGEGFSQAALVAGHLSFAWIREDRDSSLANLNRVRLGAKIDGVCGLGACQNV
jgi:hypothetical protein